MIVALLRLLFWKVRFWLFAKTHDTYAVEQAVKRSGCKLSLSVHTHQQTVRIYERPGVPGLTFTFRYRREEPDTIHVRR